ncbi:MAG: hypothetical protein ONB12_13760, partial [candidate division KSB1 bacterium]|nr:hypothetical protein [candidate division KSB1 bacterium]
MRQKLLILLFLATIFSNSTAAETPSRLTLHFGAGLAAAPSPDFLDRFWHEGVVFHFGFGVDLRSSFALAFSLTHYTFDYRSGVEPRGDKAGVNVFAVRPEYRLPFGNYRLLFAAGFGFGTVTTPP